MKYGKPLQYILIGILAIAFFFKGIKPAWLTVHSDFANYYVSAKLTIEEGDSLDRLYDNAWFQKQINRYGLTTQGKFAPFPPITAFMMTPLVSFTPLTAQRVFTVINLCFACLGIYFIKRISNWSWTQSTLGMLGLGWSLFNNIAFGQIYLIMAVGVLASFVWLQRDNILWASVILAFLIAVKYFPIVFVFSFFSIGVSDYLGKKDLRQTTYLRSSLVVVVSLSSLIIFQFLYFGEEILSQFVHSAFIPHINSELQGQGMFSYEFQSWDSLLRNLFEYDPAANPSPWVIWPEGRTVVKAVILLLLTLGTLWTMFRCRHSPNRNAVYISLPAIAALVMLPASATYHFVLLVPATICLITECSVGGQVKKVIALVIFAIGILPYHFLFAFGKTSGIMFAYPRLILITGLFIVVVYALNQNQPSKV